MKKLALLEGRTEPSKQKVANSIAAAEIAAVSKVMVDAAAGELLSGFLGRAGNGFYGGKIVRELERQFCEFFQVKHAVSFNSASTALQAAVTALGIGPGDEVITSPFTMTATPSAVLLNNAIPVFADIDPETYCLDPNSVRRLITSRTKAILTVNIFGCTSDMDALRAIADEFGLKIIEDNAQAPGGTYKGRWSGTIGDIGIFSLNVHKVMQCGEGGVLVSNNEVYATRAQLVRNHGEVIVDDWHDQGSRTNEYLVGSNYRLSEIHAAIAIEQFKKMPATNRARRETADYLTERLSQFPWLHACRVPADITHVYYLYPFRFDAEKIGISRETFVKAMQAEGYPLGVGYVKPIYLYPLYQEKRMFQRSQFPFVSSEYPSQVSYAKGICPVTERMFDKELLVTTVYQPQNGRAAVDGFIDAIARIQEQIEALKAFEGQTSKKKRKVVTIIQARMGSTRLPGKVLLDLEGKPLLLRDLERNLDAKTVDEVVVATTVKPADDAIVNAVRGYDSRVSVYRGSEDDVLDRYYQAAKQAQADIVVRITSDCPLVDPEILDQVVQKLLDDPSLDYAANVLGKLTYPRGLDVQVCTLGALEKMWRISTEAEDREHVTLYLRKHLEQFRTAFIQLEKDLSEHRWTVDERDDYRLMQEIYSRLYARNPKFRMRDILGVFEKEPALFDINHHVHQKLAQY